MTLVEELRSKKSRDNRELLDRAADRIEELEKEKSEGAREIIADIVERFNGVNVAVEIHPNDSTRVVIDKTTNKIFGELIKIFNKYMEDQA